MENKLKYQCRWCKHLSYWDGGHEDRKSFGYACGKTGYDNLRGFPFNRTKCRKYEKGNTYLNKSEVELSLIK